MKQKTDESVYAFIDSQNLNLGIQKAGWKMDWKKFRKYLADEYGVTKAYMFIGYMSEHEAMYEQLFESGYLIVLKPTIETAMLVNVQKVTEDAKEPKDPQNHTEEAQTRKPVVKGNIDAELVLYAMKELPNYKKAIIVSGDGDFYCLAEYLADKKRLLHVMTPNWQYSSLLKPYEKYIIRLDQQRATLEHKDYRKKIPRK